MRVEAVVDFDTTTQTLAALHAAAYRLVATATCQIDIIGARYVCRLTATDSSDADALRAQYLQLVTDENVRETLRERTQPVRNLILSLAFGSLAAQDK
jgi:His-Xaa-Ser system protein HxsD